MSEDAGEMLGRVATMADGDPKWDLSDNDRAALRYVLAELVRQATVIGKMRNALQPFADFSPKSASLPDQMVITQGSPMARRQLTVGDLRQAVAVLATHQ